MMAAVFWMGLLVVVVIIFWRLWVFALRIECDEIEEQQWKDYLEHIKYYYPAWYPQYQDEFDRRFKLK